VHFDVTAAPGKISMLISSLSSKNDSSHIYAMKNLWKKNWNLIEMQLEFN
jgi:hypothetical protein